VVALIGTEVIECRSDLTLELLEDEPLELRPEPDTVEIVAAPDGVPASIESSTITLHETGRYHLRIKQGAVRQDLHLVCFEPELLAHIERQCRSLGHGGAVVDAPKVRSVVRSLAQTDWFTGRIADITSGNPGRDSLANYGA
jgi:hypothetical protein